MGVIMCRKESVVPSRLIVYLLIMLAFFLELSLIPVTGSTRKPTIVTTTNASFALLEPSGLGYSTSNLTDLASVTVLNIQSLTSAPSPHPTPIPTTRQPTSTPRSTPPTSALCRDSRSWRYNNQKSKGCSWVSMKPEPRCGFPSRSKILAREACFVACNSCTAAYPTSSPTSPAPPTSIPTGRPTASPSLIPTSGIPTSISPTSSPTTQNPSSSPTIFRPTGAPTTTTTTTTTTTSEPSPQPTIAPSSASPTSEPTETPTWGYNTCRDSLNWYATRTTRGCLWVAVKPVHRCATAKDNLGRSASIFCPITCGTCPTTISPTTTGAPSAVPTTTTPTGKPTVDPCSDNTSWKSKGTGRGCEWVSLKPHLRCTIVDDNEIPASHKCFTACNTCPTKHPTAQPTHKPTKDPTSSPTSNPSPYPTISPTMFAPTMVPTGSPTIPPTTLSPTLTPSSEPTSKEPTTLSPTKSPTVHPCHDSSSWSAGINRPCSWVRDRPATRCNKLGTFGGRSEAVIARSACLITCGTCPTASPTPSPSNDPSSSPSSKPTRLSTRLPTSLPTTSTHRPTLIPTISPTKKPTIELCLDDPEFRTSRTNRNCTWIGIKKKTRCLMENAAEACKKSCGTCATAQPSLLPSSNPSSPPTQSLTSSPTYLPSAEPTFLRPTFMPTTLSPTKPPSSKPTTSPSTLSPSMSPSRTPTASPSTKSPSMSPSSEPSKYPTETPCLDQPNWLTLSRRNCQWISLKPETRCAQKDAAGASAYSMCPLSCNGCPTSMPTLPPTSTPTASMPNPSESPSKSPSQAPTSTPTLFAPSAAPTRDPLSPTGEPTKEPTSNPTTTPTFKTMTPSAAPSTLTPTTSIAPSHIPTLDPTTDPTADPTRLTSQPSIRLTTHKDPCQDSLTFKAQKPGRSCQWVSERPSTRCMKTNSLGISAFVFCPGSCNPICKSRVMETTAKPLHINQCNDTSVNDLPAIFRGKTCAQAASPRWGHCKKTDIVRRLCRKSCGLCSCDDTAQEDLPAEFRGRTCRFVASRNLCFRHLAIKHCRRSCGLCL